MVNKKIVCLGGGIGTVNLIRGLARYKNADITVIASMADDGGSTGRLRRLYGMPPTGDLVSCIAALSEADKTMKDLLVYRFAGDRYATDASLEGHRLGNFIMVALISMMGDFNRALSQMQKIFKTRGRILPSTNSPITIWAQTSAGEKVEREENIDLGRFTGTIQKLHIKPVDPEVSKEVVDAILNSDLIIAGPGDLYSTIMPVLLVPKILDAVKKSKAKKLYVVNVANKFFETPGYKIHDYIDAITNHCGASIFNSVLVNNKITSIIPDKYKRQYQLVSLDYKKTKDYSVIEGDIINASFPLYHDSDKLAKVIMENI